LQNISGTNAATWRQTLAVAIPSLNVKSSIIVGPDLTGSLMLYDIKSSTFLERDLVSML